jgi:hypothetical protein
LNCPGFRREIRVEGALHADARRGNLAEGLLFGIFLTERKKVGNQFIFRIFKMI